MKQSKEDIIKANENNIRIVYDKLSIISYLEPIELFHTGNDYFKEQAKLDLAQIREVQKDKDKIQSAWRTNDISLETIHEAESSALHSLFEAKFNEAKINSGFVTEKAFAAHEYQYMHDLYSNYYGWFPILKQWIDFLQSISVGTGNRKVTATQTLQNIILPEKWDRLLLNLKANNHIDDNNKWISKHPTSKLYALYDFLEKKGGSYFNDQKPSTEATYQIMVDYFRAGITISGIKKAGKNHQNIESILKEFKLTLP